MLHKAFQYVIEKYGEPTQRLSLTEDEMRTVSDFFPKNLVDLYQVYGRCVFRDGRIQLCRPSDFSGTLAMIFGTDSDFSHKNCQTFAYSAFGSLYLWNKDFGLVDLNLLSGEVRCRILTKGRQEGGDIENLVFSPFSLRDEALDLYDIEGSPLFSRALKQYGRLEIGECYGFVPALALGGLPIIDDIKRLKAPEHFAIISQMIDFNLIDVQGYGEAVIVRPIG